MNVIFALDLRHHHLVSQLLLHCLPDTQRAHLYFPY